jgi:hypothetical protein
MIPQHEIVLRRETRKNIVGMPDVEVTITNCHHDGRTWERSWANATSQKSLAYDLIVTWRDLALMEAATGRSYTRDGILQASDHNDVPPGTPYRRVLLARAAMHRLAGPDIQARAASNPLVSGIMSRYELAAIGAIEDDDDECCLSCGSATDTPDDPDGTYCVDCGTRS